MARKTRKAMNNENTVSIPSLSEKIYKTAIYVRLSVEDIRKKISDSIGTQKTMLFQYIQTQPDLQLYKIYEDINYTGTNFNRPGFAKMIEDIQLGTVDCIVVKDLSRFGRNFGETGHYLERVFPLLQVRFISVNDDYDSLTSILDETTLTVPLKNLMNEMYARDLSKKVKLGLNQKRKRGEVCGGVAPYGYVNSGTSFIVDEETAPIVKQIFTWASEGYGGHLITQKLNKLKIVPPGRYLFEKGIAKAKLYENSKFWYKGIITRILTNPAYMGNLAQGKEESNFFNGGGMIKKSRDEWIIHKDSHEAIIEKEVFEKVQQIRSQKVIKIAESKANYNKNDDNCENIFEGLIFCADCKRNMSRKRYYRRADGSIIYQFYCSLYADVDRNACAKKNLIENDLKDALYYYIEKQINLVADMSRIIQDIQKEQSYKKHNNTLETKINELKQQLQQNQRYRSSLREDYVDGIINEQDYLNMKSEYEEEKNNLQNDLDLLESNKSQYNTMLSEENKYIAEFRKFENEHYLSAKMVSALVERIEVHEYNKITVNFKYRNELNYILFHTDNKEQEANAIYE